MNRRLERAVSLSGVLLLTMSLCGGVPVVSGDEIANAFARALVSKSRAPEISADEDVYAKLLGAWDVQARDRTESGTFQVSEGEWFFARTLEGRAVQDVWIVPTRAQRRSTALTDANRYGSSVRTFDPHTRTWQVTWFNPVTGAFDVLHTRLAGERIVQEGTVGDGLRIRWIFQEITDTTFHWTGESQRADGSWRLEAEFYGRRR
jgi:uncharacterized protein